MGCGRSQAPREQGVQTVVAPAAEVVELRESFESVPGFEGEVYVLTAGPRDAQPLVLIHGMGDQGVRDFWPILPALSARFRVLAFDLPGLARSKHVLGHYAPLDYARMIRTLIERHFDRPVFLLGHSMGGALALQVAADMQENVSRLALLDVAGILHYREYLREVVVGSEGQTNPLSKSWRGTKRLFLKLGLAPLPRGKLEQAAIESNSLLQGFFSTSGVVALLFLQHDFGPAIRSIRAPTWLGWGATDTVAPKRTAEILRVLLRSRDDVLFLRSGHVPMRTEPARLTESLLRFFERKQEPRAVGTASSDAAKENRGIRTGLCERGRKQVFEGDYDTITLSRCKGVVLRNVRARALRMEQSSAELHDVTIETPGVAVSLKRSRIRWTGGRIEAGTCVDTERSVIDLAGVNCRYRDQSIHVRSPHTLRANVSELAGDDEVTSLHGEYRMFSSTRGELSGLGLEALDPHDDASLESSHDSSIEVP